MGHRWSQSFSDNGDGAVDRDVLETGRFDEGRLLIGDPLDFRRWLHHVQLLKGLDGPGDDHASRRHPLVGWLRVVRSWDRGQHSTSNAADLLQSGSREPGSSETDLRRGQSGG